MFLLPRLPQNLQLPFSIHTTHPLLILKVERKSLGREERVHLGQVILIQGKADTPANRCPFSLVVTKCLAEVKDKRLLFVQGFKWNFSSSWWKSYEGLWFLVKFYSVDSLPYFNHTNTAMVYQAPQL